MFWTDNITNLLVEQTNLYSTQVSGTSISTSSHEIEHFLCIHVLMGIMKLPVYDMYWAKIADVMSNKRLQNLHLLLLSQKPDQFPVSLVLTQLLGMGIIQVFVVLLNNHPMIAF